MGGGPSAEQKQAASSQAQLSSQESGIAAQNSARENDQYAAIKPYAMSRLNNGLPFYNNLTDYTSGVASKAYAPVRAATLRRLTSMGDLPSGFREASLRDIDLAKAGNYDSGLVNNMLMNEQAKSEAARLLTNQQQIANPLGYYQAAGNANQSIMQAPLQSPGLSGLLGGVAGAAINKIPF
jgi:hypothetical protein